MAENQNSVNSQGGDPVFEGGIDFRGIESSGISTDKKVADAHVKNQFGGGAGVRAGEDGDGRGLAEGTRFGDIAFLPSVSDRFAFGKALISFFKSGLSAFHFNFRPRKRGG